MVPSNEPSSRYRNSANCYASAIGNRNEKPPPKQMAMHRPVRPRPSVLAALRTALQLRAFLIRCRLSASRNPMAHIYAAIGCIFSCGGPSGWPKPLPSSTLAFWIGKPLQFSQITHQIFVRNLPLTSSCNGRYRPPMTHEAFEGSMDIVRHEADPEAAADFRDFRALVEADLVQLAAFPADLRVDSWIYRCSRSLDAFLEEFPAAAQRQAILREIRAVREATLTAELIVSQQLQEVDLFDQRRN
jgi:hypothetical protein